MRRHILAAVAALTVATSFGQTPIPPQKPVIITTEIGEVAGSMNKIQVLVASQVEPRKIMGAIQITEKGLMGGHFMVEAGVAPELAKLLDEAASKLIAGEMYSGKVGAVNVSVGELNGQKGVVLKFDRTGPSLSRDTIMLDSDNAAGLARIISRAKQVADWIMPKLATLQQ